jgi:hypothetical protein
MHENNVSMGKNAATEEKIEKLFGKCVSERDKKDCRGRGRRGERL